MSGVIDDRNSRILVVDDNRAIHEDFRKILCQDDTRSELNAAEAALFGEEATIAPCISYELDSAFQGSEALEKLKVSLAEGRPYALAFVDMRMPPGWDGLETIEHLWEHDNDLQIVICTAYSDYTWWEIVERLGHCDKFLILKKPFDNVEVYQFAAALTEKWRLSREARLKLEEVERRVDERTAELQHEIEVRTRVELALRDRDEQLRQRQKLEALGSLAGGVAHEFNNLLQVIRGYTQFALDSLPQGNRAADDLKHTLDATEQASLIVNRLLRFSRREAAHCIALDVNEAVQSHVEMLRPLIREDIRVRLVLDRDLPQARADAGMLQQVLANLSVNARDAMPNGGELTISTATYEVAAQLDAEPTAPGALPPGRYVMISVADTGCGMSAEEQQRIFEPFFTTKEVGEGTGLGLPMVFGIVQQHNGAITVESEPENGATFRVFLPLLEAAPEDLSALGDQRDQRGSSRSSVLVIDDEPALRHIVSRILSRMNLEVLYAESGAEAIQILRGNESDISLILLDITIPQMTGEQLYAEIKRIRPDVKVVLCTAYDARAAEVQFAAADQLPIVQKPFCAEGLLRVVRQAIDASLAKEHYQTAAVK